MSVTADMNGLLRYVSTVQNGIAAGTLDAGQDIVKLASELAPKDTEELANSGEAVEIASGIVEVSFGNGLVDKRAVAQEYGTYDMPAQPYLGPAVNQIDIALAIANRLRNVR